MAWLKQAYGLNDVQHTRIVELYTVYRPKCAEMCRRINEKNAQLKLLLSATNAVTPEIKEALMEAAQLRSECQTAMLNHFYEVSQVMAPEEGKKYLNWVQQETLMPGQMPP